MVWDSREDISVRYFCGVLKLISCLVILMSADYKFTMMTRTSYSKNIDGTSQHILVIMTMVTNLRVRTLFLIFPGFLKT